MALGLAGPAQAQTQEEEDCPASAVNLPCWQDEHGIPGVDLGEVAGGAAGAIGESICPPKDAPPVQAPTINMPWSEPGGVTQFQKYGYAGLRITTREQGCIAQIRTAGASGFNDVVNSVDELINAVQVGAVSDTGTSPVEDVLPDALEGLRDAFWAEWMPVVAVIGGLIVLGYGMLARSTAAGAVGVNLILVLGLVPWILGNSHYITDLSQTLTQEAAVASSQGLLEMHPSSAGDSPAAAYGDGYYQIAWRAHIEQQFQSHEECATEYAPQFVAATAFSYDEMDRMKGNPELGGQLVEEKNAEWQRLADDMAEKHPACYETWSNPANAWSGVGKHAAVTVFGGSWLFLFGIAVQALEFMLMFGLVALAALGLVMLIRQTLTSAFLGLLFAGIVGPALISLLSGGMLFFFYVVISDPGTAWYQAIIAGACMAIGAVLALRILGPALAGFAAAMGMASKTSKKGGKRAHRPQRTTAAVAAGAAAGGAVGGRAGKGSGPSVDAPRPKPVGFGQPTNPDMRVAAAPADATVDTSSTPVGRPNVDPGSVPFHDPLSHTSAPSNDSAQDRPEPTERPSMFTESHAADVPSPDLSAWANTQVPPPERDLVKATYSAYTRRVPPIGEGTTAPVDS